jgi:hypothetical protein
LKGEGERKMCNIKSAIVLKNKIYMPLDHDHHTKMLEELGIKDDTNSPKFVRVEMLPGDGDIFNHDLSNWKLKVDQEFIPDWFNKFKTEEDMKKKLPEFFEQRFIINDRSGQKREGQRLFLKNSSVVAWGNSSVVARENSSVEAWGNSSVVARGNSSVVAWGNSSVVAWGNSSVVARGNSSVVARENSSVVAWGNSQILIPYSKNVNIKGISDNASIKDLSGNKPIIYVANDNFELKQWNKNC